MNAQRIKINYRTAPLGIDDAVLRLTWNCQGGVRQTAYEIEAGSYRSGKVASSDTDAILPITPAPRERVTVRIRLWDENDISGNWAETHFEMGLPAAEWNAKWIGTGRKASKERLPAEYFQKIFSVKGAIIRARLYATACGSYTVSLNGIKLPGVLAPGSTEYGKRLYYQTYDVTALIEKDNALVFTLTDGWFMSKLGFLGQHNRFGNHRKLLCCLVVEYADGSQERISSDESFTCSWDGQIRYADLKDGEIYDARRSPSFSEHIRILTHAVVPTASPFEPIQEHEHFAATLIKTPSGKTVLDFGQNMAGYVSFVDRGKTGDVIRLQLGEVLDHGEFSRETLLQEGTPEIKQEIVYTSDGRGGTFYPEGFYSGFRYALVDAPYEIDPHDFTAIAVYSPLDFVSSFECSNPLINQFHHNTLWSLKSNFIDVPTDCPQREKSGWDGDAQVFLPTAAYMTDPAAFFRKWLHDLRDCQRKDGRVANVSPSVHPFQDREPLSGAVGWADAAVIIPYTLWKLYGDEQFLTDNLDLMRGWASYVKKASKNKMLKRLSILPPASKMFGPYYVAKSPLEQYVIESGQHWGEWLEPDADSIAEIRQPKPELTSAYTAFSMQLFAEMLDALHLSEEANDARMFSDGAKRAYNHYFVSNGHIHAPRQAPMVRALALGLLDDADKTSVAADLNRSVIERNFTVGTGFLSTPYVLGVLAENGYLGTAYKMLENTNAPGWLAMVTGGATTVWENYVMFDANGHPRRSSMNHYSPGAVCAFLYNTVCGIRVAGKNRFIIAPQPGGTLSHAEAVYNSPFGIVESAWKRAGTHTHFSISIPANTTANVMLPDGTKHEITTGRYQYVL